MFVSFKLAQEDLNLDRCSHGLPRRRNRGHHTQLPVLCPRVRLSLSAPLSMRPTADSDAGPSRPRGRPGQTAEPGRPDLPTSMSA